MTKPLTTEDLTDAERTALIKAGELVINLLDNE